MMYDMTMKVVTPAIVSRASVVPLAAKLKRRSRQSVLERAPQALTYRLLGLRLT